MHENCFELIKSERFDKDDPEHISIMKNLNTKTISEDKLIKHLSKRSAANQNITDAQIAEIMSDKDAMILCADNKRCDIINTFMAKNQTTEQKV